MWRHQAKLWQHYLNVPLKKKNGKKNKSNPQTLNVKELACLWAVRFYTALHPKWTLCCEKSRLMTQGGGGRGAAGRPWPSPFCSAGLALGVPSRACHIASCTVHGTVESDGQLFYFFRTTTLIWIFCDWWFAFDSHSSAWQEEAKHKNRLPFFSQVFYACACSVLTI